MSAPARRAPRRRCLPAAGALVTALLIAASLAGLPAPAARADVPTMSGGNLRDGWDAGEATGSMLPGTLLSGSFGELFSTPVNGQVYAEPLVLDAYHELIVVTEDDWAYGIDSTSGAIKWSTSVGTPWPAATGHCTALTPDIGITGTPVYDPAVTPAAPHGAVYFVADTVPPGDPVTSPAWEMEAIDPVTGDPIPGWPVPIQGAPANDPANPFNPFTELQRPGLLLLGGSVYAAFGGNCDYQPYDGYVVGVNTGTRAVTMWTDESGLTSQEAGIWQSGGGLVSDGPGRIFFTSGNGISPPPGPGSAPPGQLAESVVRLAVQSNGTLAAADFFSPANAPYLDSIDGDLGAGGPIVLPFGTSSVSEAIAQIGKDGRAFVLNANNLGGREQGPGGTDGVVSVSGPYGGQWGHPAAFADTPTLTAANAAASNDYVYFIAKNGALHWLRAQLGASGALTLAGVAQSDQAFGYTAGSPVVTSDGTDPSSAVVWAVNTSDDTGATGALEAYPAVPPGTCTAAAQCSVSPLWQYPLTGVGKFTTPATDSGRLYLGTRGAIVNGVATGRVLGFGSPATAPLGGASPVSFTDVPVGSASAATSVTVTNTSPSAVTVTSVGTLNAAFAAAGPLRINGGATCATTPAPSTCVLQPGDTLTVDNVTFTPSSPGAAAGALQFGTDAANFPVVSVSLSGNGTTPGLYVTPSAVSFGTQVPAGTSVPAPVTVANDSTDPQRVLASSSSPLFTLSGLAPGTVLQPGTSATLTVTYHPAGPPSGSPDGGTLTVTGTDTLTSAQSQASVTLAGTAVADVSSLAATPGAAGFGQIHLGQRAQQVITVTNKGNVTATVTAAAAPPAPFGVTQPVAAGLPIGPGYSIQIPILFTPTSAGPVSSAYRLSWTDPAGAHTLTVPVSGTGVAPSGGIAVAPPGGGWSVNGSAVMSGTTLSLTPLTASRAGSAVYATPLPANGLSATFRVRIGGGTGGHGMAFALLDAGKTTQSAVGAPGRQLGFGGLPGVAVTLDTSKDGSDYPSANFVGIATGVSGGQLVFAATSTKVPPLRTGTHLVTVTAAGGKLAVWVDGTRYLSKWLRLPPVVRLAFTGATGTKTDLHQVLSAVITTGGSPVPGPGGGWSFNGSAAASGSDTVLTPAAANRAGTVIYPVPLAAAGLRVSFTLQLSGGSGGDGMTLSLLNPASVTASSVGGNGPELGAGGLAGVSVMFATDHAVAGWPRSDFIALATGASGGALAPAQVAQGLSAVRGGPHTVTVAVDSSATLGWVVTVWLDGTRELQDAEPVLTPAVLLAFTAGTGTGTDVQAVRNVAVAASGTASGKAAKSR